MITCILFLPKPKISPKCTACFDSSMVHFTPTKRTFLFNGSTEICCKVDRVKCAFDTCRNRLKDLFYIILN